MALGALWWVFRGSVAAWLLAELWLQARQYGRRGRTRRTEWASLVVVALGFWLGVALADLAAARLPGWRLPVPATVLVAVATVVMWAGAGFRLWAIHTLGRYFRGVVHVQEGHQVVRRGPYRIVRHPAYAGVLLAVAGVGLVWGNAASWLAFSGCVLLGILYRIRVEERVLLDALGADYAEYAAHTKRLLPGVW